MSQPARAGDPVALSRAAAIRAALNRHRRVASIVALLLLAAGTILVVWTWRVYWTPFRETIASTKAYYSVDDGRTWFVDAAERVPPFDHDGKPAVRVHLFMCADRKTFVGYLEKIPDQVMQRYRDRGIDPATVDDDELAEEGGWLAKRPGDSDWTNSKTDRDRFLQIHDVRCPGGSVYAREVFPPERGR